MTQNRQEISEQQLAALIHSRITLQHSDGPKRIVGKLVNHSTVLNKRISLNSGTYIRDLVFGDCVFNGSVDIGDYDSAGSVSFESCTFNNSVRFNLDNTSYTQNCVFNDDFTVKSKKSSLSLTDLNVKGTLKIIGPIDELTLHRINNGVEIIKQKVIISSSLNILLVNDIFGQSLEMADGYVFTGSLKISNLTVSEFIIGAVVLNSELAIDSSQFSKLLIQKIEGDARKLTISNSKIEELNVKISQLDIASILECSISKLFLTEANRSENILNIEKSTILNLTFERLYNKGLITLRELKIPKQGIVSFKSTNLGKADFIYCNFAKAGLEFENSKITEAFFSETEFPKRVVVDGIINYEQAQLTFGQLASAFQKQGDNIRALEYISREVEAHYRSIKLFSRFFFRKINLWLNFISNNFGRDWVRGSIFSFSIGLLFFILLLISTRDYKFGLPSFDIDLLPAYLKFMNPLRFFELENLFVNTAKEGNIQLKSLSYLADFGGRIFIAFGYYQTIQAFRRFGRK